MKRAVFCDINITPLTDIFLVLLIIMMVVTPLMQSMRGDIKPPAIASGAAVKQNKLTVEITKDGQYFVNGEATAVAQLSSVLQRHGATLEEKNVLVRADKTTRSGAVMNVLEAARDAQFTKVTVAGEPLSSSRQDHLTQPEPPAAAVDGT
jgi:biopolymer transport protein ExbD